MLRLNDERVMERSRVMNGCFLGLTPFRGAALIPLGAVGMYTRARTHTGKEVGWGHVVQSFNPVHQI